MKTYFLIALDSKFAKKDSGAKIIFLKTLIFVEIGLFSEIWIYENHKLDSRLYKALKSKGQKIIKILDWMDDMLEHRFLIVSQIRMVNGSVWIQPANYILEC